MQDKAGVSLLFAAGARPNARDVERAIERTAPEARVARLGGGACDALELLADGRSFELCGLAPGAPAPTPAVDHTCGLPADIERFGFEAVSIVPAGLGAADGALLPVARIVLALAVGLARELPVTAACWKPAGVWIEPRYFGRIVGGWLSGGPFPAHALTCLRRCTDGAIESAGLAFFTGQELRLDPGEEAGHEAMQIAARIVDLLVARSGGLDQSEAVPGLEGETWLLVPSADRRRVVAARR
jgi:hypothetical protein